MLNAIGDANRHAYFAALNAHNIRHTNTKSLGDAHEWNQTGLSSLMDFFNNHEGRRKGDDFIYFHQITK
jgi:hypothetical protein